MILTFVSFFKNAPSGVVDPPDGGGGGVDDDVLPVPPDEFDDLLSVLFRLAFDDPPPDLPPLGLRNGDLDFLDLLELPAAVADVLCDLFVVADGERGGDRSGFGDLDLDNLVDESTDDRFSFPNAFLLEPLATGAPVRKSIAVHVLSFGTIGDETEPLFGVDTGGCVD